MRRLRQEITDEAALAELIRKAEYGVLCMTDGVLPYAVPVNTAYDGQYCYIHCAAEGKKLNLIRANPRVQICLVPEARFVRTGERACGCTMHYHSVSISGMAEILAPGTDEEAREAGLRCLAAHFGIRESSFDPVSLAKTTVLRITPEQITGKRNPVL